MIYYKEEPKTLFRLYYDGGLWGPSVSTATSHIKRKELLKWLQDLPGQESRSVVENAANFGTDFHKLAHELATKGKIESQIPKSMESQVEDLLGFHKSNEMEAVQSETAVFSKKYRYGGTFDQICYLRGKKHLIDFKTGRYSDVDLWKTESYRRAYLETIGDYNHQIEATVLYFPRKKRKEKKQYTVQHHDFCFEAFLSSLFTWKGLYWKDFKEIGMFDPWFFENPLKHYFLGELK